MSLTSPKLKAPAIQIIETGNGVILKRGCTEFKIAGEGAAEAIKKIMTVAGRGTTKEEIYDLFDPEAASVIERLSEELIDRRLLLPCDEKDSATTSESNADIFYWNFGERT